MGSGTDGMSGSGNDPDAGILGAEKKQQIRLRNKPGSSQKTKQREEFVGETTAKDTLTIGMGNSITTLDFMNGGMTDFPFGIWG